MNELAQTEVCIRHHPSHTKLNFSRSDLRKQLSPTSACMTLENDELSDSSGTSQAADGLTSQGCSPLTTPSRRTFLRCLLLLQQDDRHIILLPSKPAGVAWYCLQLRVHKAKDKISLDRCCTTSSLLTSSKASTSIKFTFQRSVWLAAKPLIRLHCIKEHH